MRPNPDMRKLLVRSSLPVCLALLLLFPVLTGCTGTEERAITFAVGGAPAELEFWEELLSEFEAGSGVRVNLMRQPTDTDQRRQGLVISLAAQKEDPDVLLMDVVWLAQFAASGWLVPLDGYARAEGDAGAALDVFFPNVLDRADRYQGELIALPVYVDGGLLYYREDVLRRLEVTAPPQTWDELVQYSLSAQEMMRPAHPHFFGFLWQGAQYEGLICNFLEFAGSNGGGIVSDNGTIAIDTPENVAAARFMVDLIHRWRVSPPSTFTEMKEEEVRIAFQQGNGLFERNWPYARPLHESAGSPVRGRTGIGLLPHFPGGRSVATLGGWHVGISQYSDQKELSWKLVRFLISYETQRKLALKLGWTPGRRDLYHDPLLLAELPHFAALQTVFENARPRPLLPFYTQVSEVLQRYLNAALAGRLTPEAALAAADRDVRSIVSRYGKEQP